MGRILKGRKTTVSNLPLTRLANIPLNRMEVSVQGLAEATRVSEMERRNMSMAEGEQCALDDFWGLVANQVEQAESTAAMEREDRRSEQVRAKLKKEERYSLWEQEDLKKRGTRSMVRESLEDAARREYLEVRLLLHDRTYRCAAHGPTTSPAGHRSNFKT